MNLRRLLRAAAVFASSFVLFSSTDARADEDFNRAAAHDAALQIACASPAALRYYARTLRDLEQRRWGLVAGDLEDDTISLVGDAVYDAAKRGDPRGDALATFLGAGRRAERCSGTDLAAAQRAIEASDRATPSTSLAECTARRIGERRKDPACSLALAAASALDGNEDAADASLADLVATATFDRIYVGRTLSPSQQDELYRHVALALRGVVLADDDEPHIADDIEHAFAGIDLDEVRAECKNEGELVEELPSISAGPQRAFCLATRSDLDLGKLRAKLTTPAHETHEVDLASLLADVREFEHSVSLDASRDAHPKEHDELAAEAILCTTPLSAADRPYADCTTGAVRSAKSGTFKLEIAGEAWAIAVHPRTGAAAPLEVTSAERLGLASVLAGAMDAAHVRGDIDALVRDVLLGERPRPEAVRDVAFAALRLRRVARALDRAAIDDDEHATILGMLDALPTLLGRAAEATGAPAAAPADPCASQATSLDKLRCATRPGGSLRYLLEQAEQRRVRDIAIRAAAHFAPSDDPRSCGRGMYGRVFVAFAAQLPDEDHVASESLATEQLRSAGAEASSCAVTRGRDPLESGLELLPSPAVRASWNGAYVNAFGGDGFRVVPSLDALIARIRLTPRGSRPYVGLQGSLVDLAAPLTELAMRRADVDYDGQDSLWLDVLRPRVEVTFGLPQVSRHLLLSTGVSLRTVAPLRATSASGALRADSARYVPIWSSADERSDQIGSFFEISAGMKYVF